MNELRITYLARPRYSDLTGAVSQSPAGGGQTPLELYESLQRRARDCGVFSVDKTERGVLRRELRGPDAGEISLVEIVPETERVPGKIDPRCGLRFLGLRDLRRLQREHGCVPLIASAVEAPTVEAKPGLVMGGVR